MQKNTKINSTTESVSAKSSFKDALLFSSLRGVKKASKQELRFKEIENELLQKISLLEQELEDLKNGHSSYQNHVENHVNGHLQSLQSRIDACRRISKINARVLTDTHSAASTRYTVLAGAIVLGWVVIISEVIANHLYIFCFVSVFGLITFPRALPQESDPFQDLKISPLTPLKEIQSVESVDIPKKMKFGDSEYIETRLAHMQSRVEELSTDRFSALKLMREHFKESDTEKDYVIDDLMLLRFLYARDFNFEKSKLMLENHVKWRSINVPVPVNPVDIVKGLQSGLARRAGFSKFGEPIVLVQVKNFTVSDFESTDEFMRLCWFVLKLAVEELPPNLEKGLIFIDMDGFSLRRHFGPKAAKMIAAFVNVVQDQNPERLRKLVLFNTPGVFRFAWKVIKGLVDPNVQEKILFATDLSVLLDDMNPEDLNVEYGGTRDITYPIEDI